MTDLPSSPASPLHRAPRAVVLTTRDLAILRDVAALRAVPLDIVASKFFTFDAATGSRNDKPERACTRRLQILATAGYLWLTKMHDGDTRRSVAMLGPRAAGTTGVGPGRNRVPSNKRAHHVRTLDAVAHVEEQVLARGGRVVRVRLDHDLRREVQHGRATVRGEKLGTFPDAVCTAEAADGAMFDVAVEYVTSKYTDADILEKSVAFAADYKRVAWFADRAATTARVEMIAGAPCKTLTSKR